MSGIFPLLGIIYIDIILPANIIRKRVYVTKKSAYDFVLGTDLLSKPALHPLKFDFQLGVLRLGTNLLPLSINGLDFSVASMKYLQKVHLSEDVILPPRCEVILKGTPTRLVTTWTQFLFELDQPKLEKLGVFAT